MKSKFFWIGIVAFICLMFNTTHAQQKTGIIFGTVTDDASAELMLAVKVQLINTKTQDKINGITDFDGKYQFKNVPAGTYNATFSFISYETLEIKGIELKAGENKKVDAAMKASANELNEVVIMEKRPVKRAESLSINAINRKSTVNVAYSRQDAPYHNTESYAGIEENGYKTVSVNPLSTFSVDVDAASYSNIRRFLLSGQKPDKGAIRLEEMINYFNYDYPNPKADDPFSITTEIGDCPWNNNKLVHIGLQGKRIDKENLPASNLVFLLDVSGSMSSPDKLPLLKKSFKMLVNELGEDDRVAIVVYAGAAGMVLKPTPGNKSPIILEALENLQAGGSTAGGDGIKLAYKVARENFIKGGNNRVILATDGDFNIGMSSDAAMKSLIEKERESGVFLTCLGFGTGNLKDSKMEMLADKGNGNYAYIDNLLEAKKVLVTEIGATLVAIAKDVKIQVEFNPEHVASYRLIGYENRLLNDEDFNDDTKDAGEIGAGHSVTALYEVVLKGNEDGNTPSVDELRYQKKGEAKENFSDELLTVKFRYKAPNGVTSKLIERSLQADFSKKTSTNFNFSATVAGFGMLLRDSEYKGNLTFADVLKASKDNKGDDANGYRAEFIRLVEAAQVIYE